MSCSIAREINMYFLLFSCRYTGWGKPQCRFYPNDNYSQVALERRVDDPIFEDLVRALAAFGFSDTGDDLEFGYREWLSVLASLGHRIMLNTKMESLKVEESEGTSSGDRQMQSSYTHLFEPSKLNAAQIGEAILSESKTYIFSVAIIKKFHPI